MTDREHIARIAFASLRSLRPALARDLLKRVGGEEEFFRLSSRELREVAGAENRLFEDALRRSVWEAAEREAEFVEKNDIRMIYFKDEEYPRRLRECEDAPLLLFGLGDCGDLNDARFVGVVGTRNATAYGVGFVDDLVGGLRKEVKGRVVVVSGLALGVDVAAHRACLREGVPTVGVLAHGLNTIYPAAHRGVAVDMLRAGGGLLSEYRSEERIHRGNFLARNRIVAGLCDCLLVAESDVKGGAMVTARIASDYSRDVFALPGRRGDRFSRGCNELIARHVAQLVTSPGDVIDAMRWERNEPEGVQGELFVELAPEEQAIVDVIAQRGDAGVSELSARIDLPVHRLMSSLVNLEFRNVIVGVPGGRYRLR